MSKMQRMWSAQCLRKSIKCSASGILSQMQLVQKRLIFKLSHNVVTEQLGICVVHLHCTYTSMGEGYHIRPLVNGIQWISRLLQQVGGRFSDTSCHQHGICAMLLLQAQCGSKAERNASQPASARPGLRRPGGLRRVHPQVPACQHEGCGLLAADFVPV